MNKENEYAEKLISHLTKIFDEESDNYIDLDELEKDDNGTDFMHALANILPTYFYRKITSEKLSVLQFNHIANQLIFQYTKRKNND